MFLVVNGGSELGAGEFPVQPMYVEIRIQLGIRHWNTNFPMLLMQIWPYCNVKIFRHCSKGSYLH